MNKIIFIILLSITILYPLSHVEAGDWTKEDTLRQIAYSTVHIIDWKQTLYLVEHNIPEGNPILGLYPSEGKVNTYFFTTLIGHTAISYILPPKFRKTWQYIWFVIEAGCVTHNYSGGVKFGF